MCVPNAFTGPHLAFVAAQDTAPAAPRIVPLWRRVHLAILQVEAPELQSGERRLFEL